MNKKAAQKKRDFLIELMQGTKENPNLKYTREQLLGIDTASKLAEILGVTRQTMSRLESCTTKLSAAQYLAICGIIEIKKNEMLYNIKNSIGKGKSILKLVDMSFYFERSFLGMIMKDEIFDIFMTSKNASEFESKLDNIIIEEDCLTKLSRMTCMDKWLATFKMDEYIDQEELFSKGYNIIIPGKPRKKDTINGIVETMKAFVKYSNNDIKSYLYLDYKWVLSFFKNTIAYFENNISVANNFIEFTTNFLLLYKNKRIKFMDNDMCLVNPTIPTKIIIQDRDAAIKISFYYERLLKYILSLNFDKNKGLETAKIIANTISNEEIIYYDGNCFKRWHFKEKDISNELKEELDNFQYEEELKDHIEHYVKLASLRKSNIDENKMYINESLDDELENVLTKFLSYLSPKTN